MAFNSIPEYTTTAATNTDIGGVSIAEGWPAANINNSERQLLAQLKTECALGSVVASASTVDISKIHACRISGTTTITTFTITDGTTRWLTFAAACPITYDATKMIIQGGVSITMAAGDMAVVEGIGVNQARVWIFRANGQPVVLPIVITPFITGLVLSNDSGTPNTVLDISAGSCRDSLNAVNLTLATAYTKTTGAWSVGSGNGGLDTGTVAIGTWYHIYIIQRPDTGVTDVLFSASATAPTLPANYTLASKRIGSFGTAPASTNIVPFIQVGDGRNREFWWVTPTVDWDINNPGTSAVSRKCTSPVGVRVKAYLNAGAQSQSGSVPALYISDLLTADVTPPVASAAANTAGGATVIASGTATVWAFAPWQGWTDTSQQVRTKATASAANVHISASTLGWMESLF